MPPFKLYNEFDRLWEGEKMTAEMSPPEMATKTADAVLKRHPLLSESWHYEIGVMLKGVEQVWRKTGASRYFDYIRRNIDFFVNDAGAIKTYRMDEYNLDQINTGKILFTLYQVTKADKYRQAIYTLREQLKGQPRTVSGGFWHKKVYPWQMWLDGIYMAAPFYAEFAATFGEAEAFDDVVRQFQILDEHATDPQSELLYHAWNENKEQQWANRETGCSPHVWGRALGWFVMALVDVLDYLPAGGNRDYLIGLLDRVMTAVLKVQDPATGVWYQVMDQGERKGNYLESSASAMFVYAMAKGSLAGYLAGEYLQAAQRGYQGLLRQFVTVEPTGNVDFSGICSVAGLGKYKEDMAYRNGSFDYYISEPVVVNDYKGVGPFMMAGAVLGQSHV